MHHPLVDLVQTEVGRFATVRQQYPSLFPPRDNLYPIPFFGDIRRAVVLTVALNPAHTEFAAARHWLPNPFPSLDTAPSLTTRLLNYFDLPDPSQHPWFDPLEKALLYIGCSYLNNAAHVDLLPFPTRFRNELADDELTTFAELLDEHQAQLAQTLRFAGEVKLLLVVNYQIHGGNPGVTSVWDKFKRHLTQTDPSNTGTDAPIIFRDRPHLLPEFVFQKRRELRDYLDYGPRLRFVGPAPR